MKICGIDANQRLSFLINAGLFDTLAAPLGAATDLGKGQLDEIPSLAGRQHEVVRYIYLQYFMHPLDIILGMPPIALRREVSEIKRILKACLHAGDAPRYFPCDEGFAAYRAFMIEDDTVRGKDAVGLAVVHPNPVAIELGYAHTSKGALAGLVERSSLSIFRPKAAQKSKTERY